MALFSIGEVCKITGLSRTTILYYESKGLITPQILDNRYHKYSMEDISQIMFYQNIKPLNISVEEYISSIHGDSNYCDSYGLIIEKKAQYIKKLSSYISMWEDTILYTQKIKDRKELFYIKENNDAWVIKFSSPNAEQILKKWGDFFLQRNYTWFIDRKTIGTSHLEYEEGISCYANCSDYIPAEIRENITYVPSSTCLFYSCKIDVNTVSFERIFKRINKILSEQNLTIIDNPWANIGYKDVKGTSSVDYLFLWIPVKKL